jgi:hypothetical protein
VVAGSNPAGIATNKPFFFCFQSVGLSLVTDFKSVSHCLFSFWIARLLQRHAGYRLLILLYLLNVLLQFGDAAVTAERLQLRNGSPQLVQRVERLSASHREMLADNTKAMRDFERSPAIAAVVLPPDAFAVVQQLRTDLRSEVETLFDRFDVDGAALQKAREMLIEAGRKLQAK